MPESVVRKLIWNVLDTRPRIEELSFFNDYADGAAKTVFATATKDLEKLLAANPKANRFHPYPEVAEGKYLTAREYVLQFFDLNPDWLAADDRPGVPEVQKIVDACERIIKTHMRRTTVLGQSVLETAASYELRLTGVHTLLSSKGKNKRPQTKEEALFSKEAFDAELYAAGVPVVSRRLTSKDAVFKRYEELPEIVRDLFFAQQAEVSGRDLPAALVRDFLMQVDDATWRDLKFLNESSVKANFNLLACEQVKRFVRYEKESNGLVMGDCDDSLLREGKLPRLSQKERALLQLLKPQKWIKKMGSGEGIPED